MACTEPKWEAGRGILIWGMCLAEILNLQTVCGIVSTAPRCALYRTKRWKRRVTATSNICLKKSVERRDNSPASNTLSGKLLYLRTKVCEMKPAVPLHSCLPRTAGASKGAFVDISCMIKIVAILNEKMCWIHVFFVIYFAWVYKKEQQQQG